MLNLTAINPAFNLHSSFMSSVGSAARWFAFICDVFEQFLPEGENWCMLVALIPACAAERI